MGTEFLGTICPWGHNWLGTVRPEGPINWGPNVRGPYVFGTKCVTSSHGKVALYIVIVHFFFNFQIVLGLF